VEQFHNLRNFSSFHIFRISYSKSGTDPQFEELFHIFGSATQKEEQFHNLRNFSTFSGSAAQKVEQLYKKSGTGTESGSHHGSTLCGLCTSDSYFSA
jgi:hypothetical protein